MPKSSSSWGNDPTRGKPVKEREGVRKSVMKRMLAGSLLFLLGTVLVGGARNLSTDEAEASAAETVTLT